MIKENLKSYSLESLKQRISEMGIEPYRAQQIFKWIWQKRVGDFSEMTNLSKTLRAELGDKFVLTTPEIIQIRSARDGTKKLLLKLEDGSLIETVYIPEIRRKTICVSTQVGCPLSCKFCATALSGFKRNLKASEIADEVWVIQKACNTKITNAVFMGMGEPLLNIDAVEEALGIFSSPIGMGIGMRHITISTVGIIKGIKYLLNKPLRLKLAISLNFPDEKMRQDLMPIARKNPLNELMKIAYEYSKKRSMVTFEYVMINGLNDRLRDAEELLRLIKGIPSKINLIPYNPHPRLPYKRPSKKKIEKFYQYLLNSPHTITLRRSRGQKILAACGQLYSP